MSKSHAAAPAHDDRNKCQTCSEPIYVPDMRFPCTFKHLRLRKPARKSVYGVRTTVLTSRMTAVELARVFADHYGYGTHRGGTLSQGGWIYDKLGRPIEQGWVSFASYLERLGYIKVGVGVLWRAADLRKPSRFICPKAGRK